jgi:acyl-[acyl-carrier-protein]-phospholipid O-acyltransferase / long-chain-fatty-acid--[acyl-carrier-protein] ligase
VVLSHHALLSNIAQIRAIIDFSAEDKVLNALPIFHSFGLDRRRPAAHPYRHEPVFVPVAPALPRHSGDRLRPQLQRHVRHQHVPCQLRQVRPPLRFLSACATWWPAPRKLSESVRSLWFEKFGIRILEGYGATETAPVLAVNTPMAYRTGSVGQLLPSIEHRLLPVPGIERGGILHVRGPNLMSGYYRYETPGQAPSAGVGGR